VLFRIEIVVTTFPVGEVVLVETGSIVVTTEGGSVFVARVNSVVGIVGTVVAGVVTASGTGVWVHPMKQTNAIKRITKPIYFFMSS
jgi:ABC-type phosphate transport system permease subunit